MESDKVEVEVVEKPIAMELLALLTEQLDHGLKTIGRPLDLLTPNCFILSPLLWRVLCSLSVLIWHSLLRKRWRLLERLSILRIRLCDRLLV